MTRSDGFTAFLGWNVSLIELWPSDGGGTGTMQGSGSATARVLVLEMSALITPAPNGVNED